MCRKPSAESPGPAGSSWRGGGFTRSPGVTSTLTVCVWVNLSAAAGAASAARTRRVRMFPATAPPRRPLQRVTTP